MNIVRESDAPCIRCGNCLPVCPVRLSPMRMFALAQDSNIERMTQSLTACVLCRRCDRACPSNLPLATTFANAQQQITIQQQQQQNAERLRQRHNAHVRRISAPRSLAKINPDVLAARAQQRAAQKMTAHNTP